MQKSDKFVSATIQTLEVDLTILSGGNQSQRSQCWKSSPVTLESLGINGNNIVDLLSS